MRAQIRRFLSVVLTCMLAAGCAAPGASGSGGASQTEQSSQVALSATPVGTPWKDWFVRGVMTDSEEIRSQDDYFAATNASFIRRANDRLDDSWTPTAAREQEIADQMTANIAEAGCPVDLEAAEEQAAGDVVAQREEALAKQLAEMRKRKRKLVDPLQYEMSIQDMDLANYRPAFGAELNAPSDSQKKILEKFGIFPDEIEHAGTAERLIDTLIRRKNEGLATPKQIRFLEGKGFRYVGTWQFEAARKMIDRIAAAGWHVPRGIDPAAYTPPKEETAHGFDWS